MYEERALAHNWLAKRLLNRAIAPRLGRLRGLVLDLGCGLRPFDGDAGPGAQFVGIDWPSSVHAVRPDVFADVGARLPFADGCADAAMAIEVLEHLPEPAAFLHEVLRVLRPGGALLLSMPFQWWTHEAPRDFQRFTLHGLEHRLRDAGFEAIEVAATSGFFAMVALKLNYRMARWIRGGKWRRRITRAALIPAWWLMQHAAARLDGDRVDATETIGFVATATRPAGPPQ